MLDQSITLKDLINNIKELKDTYTGVIVSFSYFKKKELIKYKREIKDIIYSIDVEEWKRNIIWKYFNDEEELETTLHILGYKTN